MSFCPRCRNATSMYPGERCPECWPLYLDDLDTDNFPEPFIRANFRPYFTEWSEMKRKEDELFKSGKTDEEVDAVMTDWAQNRIDQIAAAQARLKEEQTWRERARNHRYGK